ncbi:MULTISPECIES: PDxFFG protein [unclassified Mycoplasma]
MALKLSVKVAITLGAIAAASGAVIGTMIAFAKNSDEVRGKISPTEKDKFSNDFSKMYANNELSPEIAITNPLKDKDVAGYVEDADGNVFFYFNEDKNTKLTFEQFYSEYYKRYQESFIFKVTYGSFHFYDEYVLAVKPKQFLEFTKWFITNVAWGPDLMTLDSFRIVPGVEQNGNSITLGSHSTLHKEESEIKFFPDAFFGSMPMFSSAGGQGNASDSLTFSVFEDNKDKATIDTFLKNIPLATVLQNTQLQGFNGKAVKPFNAIIYPSALIGQQFLVLDKENLQYSEDPSVSVVNEDLKTIILPKNITQEEFANLQNGTLSQYKDWNTSLSDYKLMTLKGFAPGTKQTSAGSHEILWVRFEDKDGNVVDTALVKDKKTLTQNRSELSLSSAWQEDIKGFLDFYDVQNYANQKVYLISSEDGSQKQFFGSKLSALNSKIARSQNFKLISATIKSLDVVNENDKWNLKITFEDAQAEKDQLASQENSSVAWVDKVNDILGSLIKGDSDKNWSDIQSILNSSKNNSQARNTTQDSDTNLLNSVSSFSTDIANKGNEAQLDLFTSLKDSLGYVGSINPLITGMTPLDVSATDEKGNLLPELERRKYQVYIEAYPGLLDKIVRKFPEILSKQTGPHIAKHLNDKGYYEYTLENGEFYGFKDSDRVGLPLLMQAVLDDFEGISTDFLKYVGTHEYGHHLTLERTQAIDDSNNAVLVGGISTRGGATDSSFYSAKALRNYLEARTNLDFDRVDANGIPTENGNFVRYKFINNKGEWITETKDLIWGKSSTSASTSEIVANKERRFLQDWDGIVEAAKLRGVGLRDLFFANSFDENSGTLNPFISSALSGINNAKVFTKTEKNNATAGAGELATYKFVPATAQEVLSNFTDGQNTPLSQFSTVEPDGEINVRVFEWATNQDGQTVIAKVNLKTKDNQPIFNVTLNTPLSASDINYLRTQEQLINSSINNLVITQFNDSGWNNAGTFLGGSANVSTRSVAESGISTDVEESLIKRNSSAADFTSSNNNQLFINDPQQPNRGEYTRFNLVGNQANLGYDLWLTYNTLLQEVQLGKKAYTQIDNSNFAKVLGFTKSGKKYDEFVFPYAKDAAFLKNIYSSNDGFTQSIQSALQRFRAPAAYGKLMSDFRFGFLDYLGVLSSGSTDPQDLAKNKFALVRATQTEDNKLVPELVSTPSFGALRDALFDEQGREVIGIAIKTTGYAMQVEKYKLVNFINSKNAKWLKVKVGDSLQPTPVFMSMYDLMSFGSIDYSKATKSINDSKVTWNWDIDYVKSKFDLDSFKEYLLENEKDNEKLNQITESEQSLANEMMYRFRHSGLFLGVKNFSVVESLDKNAAFLSKDYGIDVLSPIFANYYEDPQLVAEQKAKDKNSLAYSYDQIIDAVKKQMESIANWRANDDEQKETLLKTLEHNFDAHDLSMFMGNILYFQNYGIRSYYVDIYYGILSDGEPSSDVIDYAATRTESQIQDKFTDYVYNLPETLTRDYVQTTYIPSTQNFGNLPKYLSNVNEATTGLDYVVDGTQLNYINSTLIDIDSIANSVALASSYKARVDRLEKDQAIYQKYSYLKEKQSEYKKLSQQLNDNSETLSAKEKADIQKKQLALAEELLKISKERQDELVALTEEMNKNSIQASDINTDQVRRSSYFGQFITKSNGYFKDRWQKETIGAELYDDNLNAIQDDTIRIKDWNGNKITNRPEAFFVSQMKNFGVGERTVAGIFRNKKLDAISMYGFVKKEQAEKIKYLEFTDVDSGKKLYLPVNIAKTNNLFYLEKQGDITSKQTLEDKYGYTSWLSDYALMAKYRNTLLEPKHKYYVNFANENKETLPGFNMTGFDFMSENGKAVEQAPVKLINNAANANGDINQVIIDIDYQFNITG